jgi:alanyl-tRNA synthetase
LLQTQRELERTVDSLQGRFSHQEILDLLPLVKEIKGVKVLSAKVDGKDPKQMRDFLDQLKTKIGSGIILLGSRAQDKVSLILGVTSDLTGRFKANDLIKKVASRVGGTGGGRADFAQAGGSDPEKLDEALRIIDDLI